MISFTNKEKIKALELALKCLEHAKELKEKDRQSFNRKYLSFGLCHVITSRYPMNDYYLEQKAVSYMVKEYICNKTVFYDIDGNRTHFRHMFMFKPQSYKYRRNWILRKIKELKQQ